MIRGANLKRLLEQKMTTAHQAGGGTAGYRGEIRKLLGITENAITGEPLHDPAQQAINASEVDFAEVADTFLGRGNINGETLRHAFDPQTRHAIRMQEAEGSVVLPSHFANISAFTDTVSGLIDVLTLEGYQNPAYIGDEFFETREARVQGGKEIGVRNDGQVSGDLAPNEPYPTVGAYETYIHIPDNQRFGNVIQMNEQVFIYDRTDQVQAMASNAGEAVRRAKELRQADCFLGKKNTYMRDGVATNTYRLARDTTMPTDNAGPNSPNNYINAIIASTPLNDWSDWNTAKQTLSKNIDPATGWEIAVPASGTVLLVSPDNELLVNTIVKSTGIQIRNSLERPATVQASTYTLNVRNSANPLAEYNIAIMSSRIWYNRLLLAGANHPTAPTAFDAANEVDATIALGDTAAKAQSVWFWGNPKRAFRYRQIKPFQTFQAQLSSEDQRRNIVAVYISEEWGVPYLREPRYMFMGESTFTAEVPFVRPPPGSHTRWRRGTEAILWPLRYRT